MRHSQNPKWRWTALLATAVLSLSACGTQGASPGGSTAPLPSTAVSSTAVSSTAVSSTAPGSTALDEYSSATIDWKQFAGQAIVLGGEEHPWMTAVKPLLPEFEALTGIKVTVDSLAESEYVAKMPTSLAGGATTPDVFMVWALGQAVDAKWLEPLDQYYKDPKVTDPAWYAEDDIFASARAFPVWPTDHVRYAVAITAEAQTMFYRKDLLAAKGLSVPKTMDELLAAAAALKTADVSGIAMRAKPTSDGNPWTAAGFIFSNGGQIIDENGRAVFNSPEAIQAVDVYARLLREDGPKGVAAYTWQESLGDFQQGKTAISADSSNFAPDIENRDKSKVAGQVVYGALPSFGGKQAKPNMWHWLLGMNAKSTHKGAAWLFMNWVTSKPTSILLGRNGAAPTRTSAWQDAGFRKTFGGQAAEAALTNLSNADGAAMTRTWFNPKGPQVTDLLAVAINKVIIGEADATTALTDAAIQVNAILGK